MRWVSVRLPKDVMKGIDKLVQEGKFPNRSEAIREGVILLLVREDAKRTSKLSYYKTARG